MTSQVKVQNESAEITKSAEKIFGNGLVESWLKFADVQRRVEAVIYLLCR